MLWNTRHVNGPGGKLLKQGLSRDSSEAKYGILGMKGLLKYREKMARRIEGETLGLWK